MGAKDKLSFAQLAQCRSEGFPRTGYFIPARLGGWGLDRFGEFFRRRLSGPISGKIRNIWAFPPTVSFSWKKHPIMRTPNSILVKYKVYLSICIHDITLHTRILTKTYLTWARARVPGPGPGPARARGVGAGPGPCKVSCCMYVCMYVMYV